jgi:hypothetical protein
MHFDHWSVVPGDPTDTSIQLRPLEPATGQALARDLVLKTRRRKGLSDSIAVSKYLEDEVSFSLCAILFPISPFAFLDNHCHQCEWKCRFVGLGDILHIIIVVICFECHTKCNVM